MVKEEIPFKDISYLELWQPFCAILVSSVLHIGKVLATGLDPWEADWQMECNVAKCHSIRVTQHQHRKQILFDYSLHSQTLENVQSAKYLGITISDNMD